MNHDEFTSDGINRRSFMLRAGYGLGALSLGQMMGSLTASAAPQNIPEVNAGLLTETHLEPRAKRIIFIHTLGAMSQADTFDYKPMLVQMHGQQLPPSVRGTARLSTMVAGQTSFPVVGPVLPFNQYGESGAWVSDLLPYTAEIVDDLAFIKSMYTRACETTIRRRSSCIPVSSWPGDRLKAHGPPTRWVRRTRIFRRLS